ncbi:MAG: hypothetical protein ACLFO3_04180 [Candidatus Acetothermia bacterium]
MGSCYSNSLPTAFSKISASLNLSCIYILLENGLSFSQIGILIGIREAGVNLLEIPSGAIADKTGRRRAMVLCFLFFYTLYNLRKPMVVGFLAEEIPNTERATILSVHSQLRSTVGMIIAPLFGFIADTLGITFVLYAGAAILLVAGIGLGFREETRAKT